MGRVMGEMGSKEMRFFSKLAAKCEIAQLKPIEALAALS
jgi:hypothetical protein